MTKSFTIFPLVNSTIEIEFVNGNFIIAIENHLPKTRAYSKMSAEQMHEFIKTILIMENPSILTKSK